MFVSQMINMTKNTLIISILIFDLIGIVLMYYVQ